MFRTRRDEAVPKRVSNAHGISVAIAVAMIASAAACDSPKSGAIEKAADSATVDSMANMAGMAGAPSTAAAPDSTRRVTFTAAQVSHGGVRWAPIGEGEASSGATIPGELLPNEDRTVRLGAPASGRVLRVSARPGDRVSAGTVLVMLQSPEAGMAQSDVAKAEAETIARRAEAQYAESARARAERLLALKAIPRQEYERAVTDDERARAALTQAQAEERRSRSTAAGLGAGPQAGQIVLRAPSAGVVLERTAVPGAVVEAGAPLVVVTDPSSLWLTINAPESMAASFKRGGSLRFSVPAFPGETFTARVDAVGAGLDAGTRTLGVRAAVSNAAGRFKPHMLATVATQEGAGSLTMSLPEDAVQSVKGKSCVFVAKPDGTGGARLEAREVETGNRSGGRISILRGVTAGEIVVISGAFAVKAELEKASTPKMEM
jgi:membrane fusion protein, heavy metal efflux system